MTFGAAIGQGASSNLHSKVKIEKDPKYDFCILIQSIQYVHTWTNMNIFIDSAKTFIFLIWDFVYRHFFPYWAEQRLVKDSAQSMLTP